MKRTVLVVVSVVVGLVLLAGLWLTLFFDVNQFRPQLEAALGQAVGRKVSVGRIRLALLSGSLAIDDLSIGDDPAFGTAPFVTAKSVNVGVRLMPLVVARSLQIESFRLDQPRVSLLRSPSGTWNFSALGGGPSGSEGAASGSAIVAGASIGQIAIVDGQVLVGTTAARGRTRTYDHVNVELSNVSLGSRFPVHVAAKTPGGGSFDLKGQAGPVNLADAAATPFQAAVRLEQLDLASTGFVDRSSGLSGVVDFTGDASSDGQTLTSTGTMKANRLTLVPGASPARVPIEIAYESDYATKTERGTLKQGTVRIGQASARLAGGYDLTGDTPAVHATLTGQAMPVTAFEAALPAVGVALPAGASLRQGTLALDLKVDGPIDGLVIAGPVTFSNLTLAGFDLGGRLGAISTLAGLPQAPDTVVQTLSATTRVAPRGIQLDDLRLIAPALGTFTGRGTISPQGALDFTMLARLASSRGAAGALGRVASLGQPANGVPFRIQGTTSRPVFVPDVGRAVTSALTSPETQKKAGELLGGLLGRTKKK